MNDWLPKHNTNTLPSLGLFSKRALGFTRKACLAFALNTAFAWFFLYQPQLQTLRVMRFVKNFHQIMKLHDAILEQEREWLRPICYNFPESNTFVHKSKEVSVLYTSCSLV